jgi:hypothetical protein
VADRHCGKIDGPAAAEPGAGKRRKLTNLEQLLDLIGEAPPEEGGVSLDAILDMVGRRSFGPLLLVAGLITLAPLVGDIPGVPTLMGLLVLLIAGQVLFRQEHFWLPRWMLNRSVAKGKLDKALKWLRRPARFVDRLLHPRLTFLTQEAGIYIIALVSAMIACAMPVMEVVPFSANAAGLVLTAFGLALIACDGVLALIAFSITALSVGFGLYQLL